MNKEAEAMRQYFHELLDDEIARFESAGPGAVKTYEHSRMIRREFCATLKNTSFTETQLDMLIAQEELLAALENYRDSLDYNMEGIRPDDFDFIAEKYLEGRYYEHRRDLLISRMYDAANELEAELRKLPAQAVIDRAREIALKTDILIAFESYRPSIHEIDILVTAADPLQAIMEAYDNSTYNICETLRNCADLAAEDQMDRLDKKDMDLNSMDVRSYYEAHVPDAHLMEYIRHRTDIGTYESQFLYQAADELRAAYLDGATSPDTVQQMQKSFSKLAPMKFRNPLDAVTLLTLNDPLHTLAYMMHSDGLSIEKAVSRLACARKLELADLAEHRASLPEQEQRMLGLYFTRCHMVLEGYLAMPRCGVPGMEYMTEDGYEH